MDLRDLTVDHLLLPVGGNPLPNAIVGPELVSPGGTITLIVSEGTRPLAEKGLKSVLEERLAVKQMSNVSVNISDIDVEEGRQSSLWRATFDAMNRLPKAQSVGMNYTCGTKAMSVHIREAVKTWSIANHIVPKLTYLNARDRKLYVDVEDPQGNDTDSCSVADIKVNLQQILSLHWLEIDTSEGRRYREQPLFSEAVDKIVAVNLSNRDEWLKWRKSFLDAVAPLRKGNLTFSKKQELENCLDRFLPSCPADIFDDIRQQNRGHLEVVKWVEGTWLEDFVLKKLKEVNIDRKFDMKNIWSSLQVIAKDPITEAKQSLVFELDVVAVDRNKFFGISCTTDTSYKGEDAKPKLKLFEAITRSRQIGGDEASIAMVTLIDADGCSLLEKQASSLIAGGREIAIFGYDHLNQFDEELEKWLVKERKRA